MRRLQPVATGTLWEVSLFHDRSATFRTRCGNLGERQALIHSHNRSKLGAFTSGASASGFQVDRPREMLCVAARFALPAHGMLLLRPLDLV